MPPPLRAAAPFAIAYRPTTEDDLPFLAALYASTRAEEVAVTGWPEEIQRQLLKVEVFLVQPPDVFGFKIHPNLVITNATSVRLN